MKFFKYQGTGNDFILIDNREDLFPSDDTKLVEKICDRRFGIGADGLILLEETPGYDFKMVYFNSDGRESTMCGNGGRCIAAFAAFLGIAEETTSFLAIDGPHTASFSEDKVYLGMKEVHTIDKRNEDYVLNTGSPHYVKFVKDVSKVQIVEEARKIRNNHEFKSEGINVNFVEIIDENKIKVRTYERGVEDETFSCGTGVVASVIATYIHTGQPNDISAEVLTSVEVVGGSLEVSFLLNEKGQYTNVTLIGPAIQVFEGEYEINL